jgi:hypothetical protein
MLFKDGTQHIMKLALASRQDSPRLRFTSNGTFQISVFSDLHFAESIQPLNIVRLRETGFTDSHQVQNLIQRRRMSCQRY